MFSLPWPVPAVGDGRPPRRGPAEYFLWTPVGACHWAQPPIQHSQFVFANLPGLPVDRLVDGAQPKGGLSERGVGDVADATCRSFDPGFRARPGVVCQHMARRSRGTHALAVAPPCVPPRPKRNQHEVGIRRAGAWPRIQCSHASMAKYTESCHGNREGFPSLTARWANPH